MKVRAAKGMVLVITTVIALISSRCAAQRITATQESDKLKTIRVVCSGRFESIINKRQGFGEWYDLKNDPEKKRDMGSVNEANGFLWTKTGLPEGQKKGGSWYANPPEKMELLEAGPVRVRVRLSGPHNCYGSPKRPWNDLRFEQTYTIYPTGDVYTDYVLITQKRLSLHHFNFILRTTGRWGHNFKGEGGGEVKCASEAGETRIGREGSSFVLQWSNGPTYFVDILMVMQKGRYGGSYWNGGFRDLDFRTGLNIMSRWPEKTLPKGRDHIHVLTRFADDINGSKAAMVYANDYRTPDKLDVSLGKLDTTDEGDADKDGFNEAEGCYVLKASPAGVTFTLHGKKTPRMDPAFKIRGWTGKVPKSIKVGSKELIEAKDFNASVKAGVLLLQLFADVRDDARLVISPATGSGP